MLKVVIRIKFLPTFCRFALLELKNNMINNLLKYYNKFKSRNEAYLNELRNDHDFFRSEITTNFDGMTRRLCKRYRYFSLDYIKKIVGRFKEASLLNNPMSMRYIESEFAILDVQLDLMKRLKQNGLDLRNKTVLDIGCAAGCLLFACSKYGAAKLVGIDISQDRLNNAKELMGSKLLKEKADLLCIDIFSQELPYGKNSFDVIFSTNVMEHVPSAHNYFGKIKEYLSDKNRGSFAFTSVGNKYNISNVLTEPHYGIPGLILLSGTEAADIWYSERKKLSSDLDYEVFEWYLYEEYKEMAFSHDLEIFPLLDKYEADLMDAYLIHHMDFAHKYYDMAINKLRNYGLEKSNYDKLDAAIRKYFDEYIKDHTVEKTTPERKLYLYLKYHAFVLEFVAMHGPVNSQCATTN